MTSELKRELKIYVSSMTDDINKETSEDISCKRFIDSTNDFYFIDEHSFSDYCKQSSRELNCVGIYVDGNFFLAARIPYRFHTLPCKDIVECIYGTSEEDTFLPDYNTPEYEDYMKKETFNLWKHLRDTVTEDIPFELGNFLARVDKNDLAIYEADINNSILWSQIIDERSKYIPA